MESVIEREAATVGTTADEIRRGYENQVSMRTLIDASDIADMAVFLAGDGARVINGQMLSVDGNTETLRTVRRS
jgi:NAD(P)-dependent dehydrogenase (short-subunit alcohol dehydrogenase family)